jgi:hypothetical protein
VLRHDVDERVERGETSAIDVLRLQLEAEDLLQLGADEHDGERVEGRQHIAVEQPQAQKNRSDFGFDLGP